MNMQLLTLSGPFRYPILGNVVQLGWKCKKKPIYEVFEDMSSTYGPIFTVQAGTVSQGEMFCSDPH